MNRKQRKLRARRIVFIDSLTEIANEIRDNKHNLTLNKIYKAELMSALKRNELQHTREVSNDSERMCLTNQSKRDAELNRRMFNDTQRETFNDDLKKINRAMSDFEIEIEYNSSILKIKLASVIEDVI